MEKARCYDDIEKVLALVNGHISNECWKRFMMSGTCVIGAIFLHFK
jgi:hypothetical protein